MTDAASSAPDLRAIVQRRLIGLAVLLLAVFLLSLLLRTRPAAPDALPSVVIPLGAGNVQPVPPEAAGPVPTLDVPEPSRPAAPAAVAPEPAPLAERTEAKPKPVEPVISSPPKPKPTVPAVATPKPKVEKPPAPKPAAEKPKAAAAPRWYVAVGAYKDPTAAQAIANRIKLSGFRADTVPVTTNGNRLNRVRAGPFASRAEAESARATLIVEGLTKSIIVGEK